MILIDNKTGYIHKISEDFTQKVKDNRTEKAQETNNNRTENKQKRSKKHE